jgi:hypothetical protein
MTYRVVRYYQPNPLQRSRVILSGLTEADARAHCQDPESSSLTATGPIGRRRTRERGAWFDGYEKEQ